MMRTEKNLNPVKEKNVERSLSERGGLRSVDCREEGRDYKVKFLQTSSQ